MKRLLIACALLAIASPAFALVSVTGPSPANPADHPPPADDRHCTTCDGIHLMQQGQYGRAKHVFELRTAQGDATAMVYLGYMYENGLGTAVDYDKARRYYAMGAKAGDPLGTTSIGMMLQHGKGGPVDYPGALRLYRVADAKGDDTAMNQIGFMYQHGLGLRADPQLAWCWYDRALTNGHDDSFRHIRELSEANVPAPKDCATRLR